MLNIRAVLFLACWACFGLLTAQTNTVLEQTVQIRWEAGYKPLGAGTNLFYPFFQGAIFEPTAPNLPVFVYKFALNGSATLEVSLQTPIYEPLEMPAGFAQHPRIGTDIQPAAALMHEKGQAQAQVKLIPIRRNPQTNQLEKLVQATLALRLRPLANTASNSLAWRNATTSKLSDGQIFKIALSETGVYKLDYNFLRNLGLPVDNLDPRQLQVLGNGGELLPENNSAARPDDLTEQAIVVTGEADGKFDSGDFVLFYAKGTKYWKYEPVTQFFAHNQNIYTAQTYYYVKIGSSAGKRVNTANPISSFSATSNSYDILAHLEEDKVNLLNKEQPTIPPSGREWLGAEFITRRSQSFSFDMPNRQTNEPIKMRSALVARAFSSSTFAVAENGRTIYTANIGGVAAGVYDTYALKNVTNTNFTSSQNPIKLDLTFSNPASSANAWVDFLTLNGRANLTFNSGQLEFRDQRSLANATTRFQISNPSNKNLTVWEVTNSGETTAQSLSGNSTNMVEFVAITKDILREFVAFDGSSFKTPANVGSIPNQNLHALQTPPALLIVYHKNFEAAAQRLAQYRNNQTPRIPALAVEVSQIYNEFGSGNADISSIRDFVRMLYKRSAGQDSLRYLLLMGAGSFDYKNIAFNAEQNSNFVPTYETPESYNPITAFCSDDYYGLLDDNEGNVGLNEPLDIAIGRIPALTATDAERVVDKIVRYETAPATLGDWRNEITLLADDEDGDAYVLDAERVDRIIHTQAADYNVNKIYLDAYQQVSTGGGYRYPDATEGILRSIFKGTLVMNYIGHGTDDGLAQERIFTNVEINGLQNANRLPLFLTATCSFSPYDDPSLVSAGELLLLNPNGGGIAMLTTVRVVYANENATLVEATYNSMFSTINGRMPTVGELLTRAKNSTNSPDNTRKFVLLGDPSMTLAYPKQKIQTISINNQPVRPNQDTARALERVTISGQVLDANGNLDQNFNGTVYPTIYDKVDTMRTRKNDPGSSVVSFPLQKQVLFKGRATVSGGKFTYSFVLPKDLNYKMGNGRLSYYADNGQQTDAAGTYTGLIIGGTNPNPAQDNTPPQVKVFMNDRNFVYGGTTDANPTILVELYDENGINTAGSNIGHDLIGELSFPQANNRSPIENPTNNQIAKNYILNDFYQAATDDYKRGTVRYPLRALSDGRHSLKVEAWDVYNNVGYGNTEFVVASSANLALQHVLNYPNPFTTQTRFQFEHNYPNQPVEVQIQIFTVAGRLVKTIQSTKITEGYRVTDIAWDGLDEYGEKLAIGTYIYKVTISTEEGNKQLSEYQKLVILR